MRGGVDATSRGCEPRPWADISTSGLRREAGFIAAPKGGGRISSDCFCGGQSSTIKAITPTTNAISRVHSVGMNREVEQPYCCQRPCDRE